MEQAVQMELGVSIENAHGIEELQELQVNTSDASDVSKYTSKNWSLVKSRGL